MTLCGFGLLGCEPDGETGPPADAGTVSPSEDASATSMSEDAVEGCEDHESTEDCSWPHVIVGEVHTGKDLDPRPELTVAFHYASGAHSPADAWSCPRAIGSTPCHHALVLTEELNDGVLVISHGGVSDSVPLSIPGVRACAVDITYVPVFIRPTSINVGEPRIINPCD